MSMSYRPVTVDDGSGQDYYSEPLSSRHYPKVKSRKAKIRSNRVSQGFWELFNHSNYIATGAEFIANPGQAFMSLWFVRWVNAPIGIALNFLLSLNAIRKAYIKKDAFSIANAFVVVATSVGMMIAGIAIAAGITVMSAVAPALICASLGIKALWDLGSSIVFAIKAACTDDEELNMSYRNKAIGAFIDGTIGAAVTAAVVAVYAVAAPIVQTILTGIAIAASSIGVIATFARIVFSRYHAETEERALIAAEEGRSSTCCMNQRMEHDGDSYDPLAHLTLPQAGALPENTSSSTSSTYSSTPTADPADPYQARGYGYGSSGSASY